MVMGDTKWPAFRCIDGDEFSGGEAIICLGTGRYDMRALPIMVV